MTTVGTGTTAVCLDSSVVLAPLRWWHLRAVMELERDLFGNEQWSEESYWSELAHSAPTLFDGPQRRYWAAFDPASPEKAATPQVLGYAGLAVNDDEGYVQTIGVARAARRRGIGSVLLARLLADARTAGARTCWLEVRADNPGAQAMYERFGFRVQGRRRGYYQPSGVDALVMSAPLDVVDGNRQSEGHPS